MKRKIKSEASRVKYLQELHRFLKYVGSSDPDSLVRMPKHEVEKAFQGFVDELADKGLSIRYVNTLIADLKLFFKVNGFKNSGEIDRG